MPADLTSATLAELSARIEAGEVHPVALAEAALEVIEAHDGKLRAFIDVYADEAVARAEDASAEIRSGHYRGPLHGVPTAVKDNIYVAGKRTTMGSKIHADFVPDVDAGVTTRLADAGAVVVGKTNMHE